MKKRMSLGPVAGLMLLCVFACAMLITVLLGARVYRDVSAVQQEQFSARTAASYLATRIHQADAAGAVRITNLGEESALAILESGWEENYITYIYCHEGYLKELYCPEQETFGPEAGESILRAEELTFAKAGKDLLEIRYITSSGTQTQYLRVLGLEVQA